MRLVKHLWFCLLILLSGHSYAEITSPEEAINATAHQSMLTQRMFKDYILIGMSVRARKAEQDLKQAMDAFEQAHDDLENYAKTDAYRSALKRIEQQWESVKPLYLSGVSKAQVGDVRDATEVLLEQLNNATTELVEASETTYGGAISTAGYIRMLSQRIAGLYALKAWGFEDKYDEAFTTSLAQFELNRASLEANTLNNEALKAELNKVPA